MGRLVGASSFAGVASLRRNGADSSTSRLVLIFLIANIRQAGRDSLALGTTVVPSFALLWYLLMKMTIDFHGLAPEVGLGRGSWVVGRGPRTR